MAKDEFIILRIESDIKRKLRKLADKNGLSLSEYIRAIFEDSLDLNNG